MEAGIDTGDTAWVMTATALVMFMTIGLGLFYAGLVRAKNTLNTFMMCLAALGVVTISWALIGYSLAFGDGSGFIGNFDYAFLKDVGLEPVASRRSRTWSSSSSRARSASSRPRWSRARWWSACASCRSWASLPCGRSWSTR